MVLPSCLVLPTESVNLQQLLRRPHITSTSRSSRLWDTVGVLADDKVGGVTAGGNFCLDLVYDTGSGVWAGPPCSNKWAVALLNRDPTANATITLDFASMLNVTAGTSFDVRDVWQQKDAGTPKGSYTPLPDSHPCKQYGVTHSTSCVSVLL